MKKAQAIKRIDYITLLETLLSKDQVQRVKHDVDAFMRRDHRMTKGVLNVILMRTIMMTNGDFNEVYLRKVAETFRAYGITTVELAIEYLDKNHENKKQIQQKSSKEPDWMDEYIESLANLQPV